MQMETSTSFLKFNLNKRSSSRIGRAMRVYSKSRSEKSKKTTETTMRRTNKQSIISQRCQFFERLMAGADPDTDPDTDRDTDRGTDRDTDRALPRDVSTTSNHVYSTYDVPQNERDDLASEPGRSVDESNDEICDNSGTSDEMTVNSTEASEDYPTDPSDVSSRKSYGFYNIFPGLPDEDLDSLCGVDNSEVLDDDSVNNSLQALRDEIKNDIDRMVGPVEAIQDNKDVSESELVKEEVKNSVNDELSLNKIKENRRQSILRDLSGTINELLSTEQTYIENLAFVCDTYMVRARSDEAPEALQGKSSIIFGNMEKIKDFHKNEFLPALQQCHEDPELICNVFTTFIKKLNCYTEYALNKPHSEKLMKEVFQYFEIIRKEIKDLLGLNSFLLKPLQRLVKYRQLIERIGKNLKKLETDEKIEYSGFRIEIKSVEYSRELQAAIAAEAALTELQQQGNDVLMVPFIIKCQLPLESFKLLKASKLVVNKRNIKYQVFLFENLILFTEPTVMNNEDLFLCKDYIYLDRILPPVECQKSSNSFTLTSSENKSRIFHIRCSNAEERASWLGCIRNVLFQQQQAWKEAIKHKTCGAESPIKTVEEVPKIVVQMPPIINCPYSLDEMGQLRKCGKLTIKFKNTMFIGHVTLYEKIVIFSTVENNHFEEILKYDSSITAENLCISPNMGNSPSKFHVWCNRTKASYILQAKSEEAKSAWTKQFDKVVSEQEALRLRNSLAARDYTLSLPERKSTIRSLRGVPGECNRRSLPPISTIWHTKLDFDDDPQKSSELEESPNEVDSNEQNSKTPTVETTQSNGLHNFLKDLTLKRTPTNDCMTLIYDSKKDSSTSTTNDQNIDKNK